jgi:hypothetical protein
MARLPLKPPKLPTPKDTPAQENPTIRMHGGISAAQDSTGRFLPVPRPPKKRQRLASRIHSGSGALPTAETSASESDWPPKSPLILMPEQLDELGKYIKADSGLLEQSGFNELVRQRRGRSDFTSGVKGLKHKAASYLTHLQKAEKRYFLAICRRTL